MLDDMDRGPKIVLLIIVAALLFLLAVPLVVLLAAVIATFVLGLGEEAVLLAPVCGPAAGRRVRRTAVGVGRRCFSSVRGGLAAAE
jgi:FlaG/FlaF family flagellin (archaellin)